jgi:hypothetical protein
VTHLTPRLGAALPGQARGHARGPAAAGRPANGTFGHAIAPRRGAGSTHLSCGRAGPGPMVGSLIGAGLGAFFGSLLGDLGMECSLPPSVVADWGAAVGRFWGTISNLAVGTVMMVVLVDCSVSFRTNYRALLSGSGIQIPATPRPREGMRKPAAGVDGPSRAARQR